MQSSISKIQSRIDTFEHDKRLYLNEKTAIQDAVVKTNELVSKDMNLYIKNFKQTELKKSLKGHIKDISMKEKEISQK